SRPPPGPRVTADMRRIGHHCYTSLGGYRSVHLSPWLEPMRALLEQRALACYSETDAFDLVHGGGFWLATFVIPNGVDHVRRPRNLVQQVVVEDASIPPIFSPLFLRATCLERLDQNDPALEQRLITDIADIDLRRLMPPPERFGELFSGPAGEVVVACYEAMARPEDSMAVTVERFEACREDLTAALCAPMVHGERCHISCLSRPLPDPFGDSAARVHIRHGKQVRTRGTVAVAGVDSPARLLTELVARSRQPQRLLLLLRRLPVPQVLDSGGLMQLLRLSLDDRLILDAHGLPQLGRGNGLAVLTALLRLGGLHTVRDALAGWSATLAHLQGDVLDDIDARIIACAGEAELAALAQASARHNITL
ncbi:MAG: hypothetical protein ACOCXA_04980, partial [Planctomycetota bacterium]